MVFFTPYHYEEKAELYIYMAVVVCEKIQYAQRIRLLYFQIYPDNPIALFSVYPTHHHEGISNLVGHKISGLTFLFI